MSSRAIEYPRASAALTGLGLTTQLAAAATDSIPIAQLVLGVVSRIVTLASDVEKSRDALHQLVADARKMGDKIPAVVSGRQLGPEIQRSLEDIYEVLRSIETLLKKHKAKNPFHKAISYAFTTSKRVDGLRHELSRATQELQWAPALDTNAQVRDNSPYIGEFRHIRLCDVDDLTLISEHQVFLTGYSSQIYSGRVNGCVVVLRCFERNSIRPDEESYWEKTVCHEVREHDQLLEKLSTVPGLHRNIVRLYGKSSGEHIDRFNVMKSGCSRISKFRECPATIDSTWNIISQLVDAAIWLEAKGLAWYPEQSSAVFIDGTGVPIIGLHNDLRLCDTKEWHIWVLHNMLKHAYAAHWEQSKPNDHTLDTMFDATLLPRRMSRYKATVPRRLIPTLNGKISAYITNALQSLQDPFMLWVHTGAVILQTAASGCTVESTFYTKYYAKNIGRPSEDSIFIARVDESDTELVHWTVSAHVPTSMTETFRKKLGITLEGHPNDPEILYSSRDPPVPALMRFTRRRSASIMDSLLSE